MGEGIPARAAAAAHRRFRAVRAAVAAVAMAVAVAAAMAAVAAAITEGRMRSLNG
jgi:hypothetical protein